MCRIASRDESGDCLVVVSAEAAHSFQELLMLFLRPIARLHHGPLNRTRLCAGPRGGRGIAHAGRAICRVVVGAIIRVPVCRRALSAVLALLYSHLVFLKLRLEHLVARHQCREAVAGTPSRGTGSCRCRGGARRARCVQATVLRHLRRRVRRHPRGNVRHERRRVRMNPSGNIGQVHRVHLLLMHLLRVHLLLPKKRG